LHPGSKVRDKGLRAHVKGTRDKLWLLISIGHTFLILTASGLASQMAECQVATRDLLFDVEHNEITSLPLGISPAAFFIYWHDVVLAILDTENSDSLFELQWATTKSLVFQATDAFMFFLRRQVGYS
jgi:hypothetical protein